MHGAGGGRQGDGAAPREVTEQPRTPISESRGDDEERGGGVISPRHDKKSSRKELLQKLKQAVEECRSKRGLEEGTDAEGEDLVVGGGEKSEGGRQGGGSRAGSLG